jgi:hypothetical protein
MDSFPLPSSVFVEEVCRRDSNASTQPHLELLKIEEPLLRATPSAPAKPVSEWGPQALFDLPSCRLETLSTYPMDAIAFLRDVLSDHVSVGEQASAIEAHCDEHKIALLATYRENLHSSAELADRHVLNAALDAVRSHRCALIVYKLACLSEVMADNITIFRRLEKAGARLIVVNDPLRATASSAENLRRLVKDRHVQLRVTEQEKQSVQEAAERMNLSVAQYFMTLPALARDQKLTTAAAVRAPNPAHEQSGKRR